MSEFEFKIEDGRDVFGHTWKEVAAFIAGYHKISGGRYYGSWTVNRFKLLSVSREIEDWWAYDQTIHCYDTIARVPTRWSSSNTSMVTRWKLTLR